MGTIWIIFTSLITIASGLGFAKCVSEGFAIWLNPKAVRREQRGLIKLFYAILCFCVPVKIFPISLEHIHIGVVVFLLVAAVGILFIKPDLKQLAAQPPTLKELIANLPENQESSAKNPPADRDGQAQSQPQQTDLNKGPESILQQDQDSTPPQDQDKEN